MSSAPREVVACLRAVSATAARQREALITGEPEALRTQNEALAALLVALQESLPGSGDAEVVRLALEVQQQLRTNAALAENGRVITEHLVTGLEAVRQGGVVGCQLSAVG